MTSDISIYQAFPSENEIKNMQMIATVAYKSGLYKSNPDAIVMTLLSARELNIGPMLALNGGIWNINGKVEISARLMSVLIRRAGHSLTISGDAKSCTVSGKRKDTGDVAEVTFTIADADKAGLLGNPVWKKYPEDMLYARALSRLSRRLFADVIQNCYVEGEISDTKFEEKAIESLPNAEAEVVSPPLPPEPASLVNEQQAKELNSLRMLLKEEDREKLDDWIEKNYIINSMEYLPALAYDKVIRLLEKKVKNENSKS